MNLAALKSLQWIDFFMYALTDPGALYRLIRKNEPRPFALSYAVPVIVVLLDIIASSLVRTETPAFYSRLTYGWLLSIFFTVFTITVSVALMDGFAQFLGYRGNLKEMISLVNFSLMPSILLLPATYVFKVIHFAPPFFHIFFSMAAVVWSAFIAVKGISEMHDSGLGNAVLIYLFPYLFTGVMALLMVILGVMYAVRLLF